MFVKTIVGCTFEELITAVAPGIGGITEIEELIKHFALVPYRWLAEEQKTDDQAQDLRFKRFRGLEIEVREKCFFRQDYDNNILLFEADNMVLEAKELVFTKEDVLVALEIKPEINMDAINVLTRDNLKEKVNFYKKENSNLKFLINEKESEIERLDIKFKEMKLPRIRWHESCLAALKAYVEIFTEHEKKSWKESEVYELIKRRFHGDGVVLDEVKALAWQVLPLDYADKKLPGRPKKKK